ncbi:MAG TPA: hypothetical protein VGR51_03085 [Thermoplasmata archaeon]|nr:hypothetical protein [Thermoplasmata archaeon]
MTSIAFAGSFVGMFLLPMAFVLPFLAGNVLLVASLTNALLWCAVAGLSIELEEVRSVVANAQGPMASSADPESGA